MIERLNWLNYVGIAFLPRSKHLLISWLQSPSTVILEPQKIKSVTVSIVSPSICHEVMEPGAMIFIFWVLSFKPAFSLSSFTFIKKLFSSSLLSAIRVVSSVYLGLLIFLMAILIPAWASSSPAFHMMYSAYKLNKQGDNIQPWCTPFQFGPVHSLDHWKSKRIPEKNLCLYWLRQSLWLCGSQAEGNSSRDGNTRPPYLSPEKSVCRSRSNS